MSGNRRRWRRLAASVAVLVAAFAATTTVTNAVQQAPAFAAPTPGQQYYLQNVTTGLRLQVAFASTAPGAPIIQGGASSTTLQAHWRFAPVAGTSFYQIINRRSGICLNVGPASVRIVIRQNTCTSLVNFTHWTVSPIGSNYRIIGRTSNQSLCIIGDLNFASVPLVSDVLNASCDDRFTLIPV